MLNRSKNIDRFKEKFLHVSEPYGGWGTKFIVANENV
jgi:hypothetical protein